MVDRIESFIGIGWIIRAQSDFLVGEVGYLSQSNSEFALLREKSEFSICVTMYKKKLKNSGMDLEYNLKEE